MFQLPTSAVQKLSSLRAGESLNQLGHSLATIDFETRSRLELMEVGAFKYSEHESTEVLSLAYDVGRGPQIWHQFLKEPPIDLFAHIWEGGIIEAHNAEFEYCIWKNVCVKKYGWPELEGNRFRCSAAKAAVMSMPRKLEKLCAALDSPIKKDLEGKKHMLKMSKPRNPTKKNPNEWLDGFADYERLFDYNIDDIRSEESCSQILPPLSLRAQKLWELTLKINERGIHIDSDLCEIALDFARRFARELQDELGKITNGVVRTAKQNAKMKDFLKIRGVLMENLQAGTVDEVLKAGSSMDPVARRVLEIRQALGKSSITKYKSMLNIAGKGNRVRGSLLAFGASTGRYTGRGIQPQNFVKAPPGFNVENVYRALALYDYEFFKTVFPDVYLALSAGLRGMICAESGKILRVADWNAIEARIIQWLAGDYENLKIYNSTQDPYKDMASIIYGVPYSKVTKAQREVGKRAVLGCGFGMGWRKFAQTCEQFGMPVSDELAQRAVEAYREKYYLVKEYWYALEAACIQAVRRPMARVDFNNLQILFRGRWLMIQLPSGRRISYYEPQIKTEKRELPKKKPTDAPRFSEKPGLTYMAEDPKTKQWVRERTYGGKLAENVTQAVAADVMTEGMFRVERAGYSTILTVHDEVVTEDLKTFGTLKEFETLMSVVPKWAIGLPVKVETFEAERYRK